MNKVLERLKELIDEESRYAYADTVADAFLIGQIKTLREERGLTQEQLATLVGTQQSGISRWLNSGFSTCKVETLRKFAKAYGVRLRISFEEFGTLPTDVGGFTKERLTPRKFEDDPAFKDQPEASGQTPAASLAGAGHIWGHGAIDALNPPPEFEACNKALLEYIASRMEQISWIQWKSLASAMPKPVQNPDPFRRLRLVRPKPLEAINPEKKERAA